MKKQLPLNSIIQHFEGTCSRSKRATTHGRCTAKTFAASILKRPISSQKKKKKKSPANVRALRCDWILSPFLALVLLKIVEMWYYLCLPSSWMLCRYCQLHIYIPETARPFTSKVIEKLYFCLQPQLLFLLVPPATTTTTTPVRKWGIRPVSWNYLEQDINII